MRFCFRDQCGSTSYFQSMLLGHLVSKLLCLFEKLVYLLDEGCFRACFVVLGILRHSAKQYPGDIELSVSICYKREGFPKRASLRGLCIKRTAIRRAL